MATASAGRLAPLTQSFISQDDISEIFGSISMAAFLCLLLASNYRLKSAESLSMAFLFIWLLGDVTNLLGEKLFRTPRLVILNLH
ncbi:vacuolar membrane PQ-loop repeat protein [Colletotrichum tofieldiae]|nr:vacuolar membrane PQ-loop repeat protein [Colletotrichum tofieldiae]GKT80432.1 vacuolar membrane PQ-loop repeat protein [Colletotrichum tofieldiae]GKT94790.1 vacuolar membrane PQ-loop repeat protein [Colletotrichum tofieldiae]